MNPDDFPEELFRMSWRQDYPEFQEAIDREMNVLLELSDYTEAKEVIKMIKAKL